MRKSLNLFSANGVYWANAFWRLQNFLGVAISVYGVQMPAFRAVFYLRPGCLRRRILSPEVDLASAWLVRTSRVEPLAPVLRGNCRTSYRWLI